MKPHPLFGAVGNPGAEPVVDPIGRSQNIGIPVARIHRRFRFLDRYPEMGGAGALNPDRHEQGIVFERQCRRRRRCHRVYPEEGRFQAVIHAYIDQHDRMSVTLQYLGQSPRTLAALHDQFNAAAPLPVADACIDEWIVERPVDDGQWQVVFACRQGDHFPIGDMPGKQNT